MQSRSSIYKLAHICVTSGKAVDVLDLFVIGSIFLSTTALCFNLSPPYYFLACSFSYHSLT